ncbi:MAG: fibronectin type III domain-containing protein [Bryobacteraceae bacterium]
MPVRCNPTSWCCRKNPIREATQTGQANLNNAALAAAMISQQIAAVRALNLPNVKLGAGFGTWVYGLLSSGGYLQQYTALNVPPNNLDYIDFHVYPTFIEGGVDFLQNALTIANAAQQAGMGVGMSEAWMWKMEANEWNVLGPSDYRGRNPFSFWAPLDAAFLQTMQNLAQRTQMFYQAPEGPYYLFNYQDFGGTVQNGGLATCTCTTSSCSSAQIIDDQINLTAAANQQSLYSTTGLSYYNSLVTTPDTAPPTTPTGLTGSAGYNQGSVSWNAATDNIGVAGYNVNRDGKWLANSASNTFIDTGLSPATTYHYVISAFDLAGNTSPNSVEFDMTTADNIPPTTPNNLTAKPVSPQEIDLSWSPAQDIIGLASYRIFRGDSPASLAQVATRTGTSTLYKDYPLTSQTQYYYAVEAVDTSGNASPMSNIVSATTLNLPSPPATLTATATSAKQIKLTWSAGTGGLAITAYHVLQGPAPDLLTQIAVTNKTTYTTSTLSSSTTYYFAVQSVDTVGDVSIPSPEAYATTYPNPNAPTNLTMTAASANRVTLTWTEVLPPRGLPIANYKVFCGTSQVSMPQVGTITTTTYNYTLAQPATTYYCSVQAADNAQDLSPMSAISSVTTPPMPNMPTNVTAVTNSATKVTYSWTETVPVGGMPIGSYKVYCGTSPGSLTLAATVASTAYGYTNRTASTTYYCAIQASDKGGDLSPMSQVVSATTAAIPNAPVALTATANNTKSVTVSWSEAIPPGGLPVSSYKIYRGTSPAAMSQVATRATPTYTDTAISPGTTYYYQVQAMDSGGDLSPMSALTQVTTP